MQVKINVSKGYIQNKVCPEEEERFHSEETERTNYTKNEEIDEKWRGFEDVKVIFGDLCRPDFNKLCMKRSEEINKFLKLRKNLISWVSTITDRIHFSQETFFLTVDIFDQVMSSLNFYTTKDLALLLIITSFVIAVKYHEVKQLRIADVVEHIAKKEFTAKQILQTEMKILKILKFRIPKNNFQNFIKTILGDETNLQVQESLIIFNNCCLIYKTLLYDYKILRKSDPLDLYFGILEIGININKEKSIKNERIKKIENLIEMLLGNNRVSIQLELSHSCYLVMNKVESILEEWEKIK